MSNHPNYFAHHRPYENAKEHNSLGYKTSRESCFMTTLSDGKEYAVKITPPPSTNNFRKTRKSLRRSLPVFSEKTFHDAPDGIYAWLYTDKGFFTIKVDNLLEFGTRHIQLADRIQATKVYLGGELEKTRNNIMFNVLSGSFMPTIKNDYGRNKNYEGDARKLFTRMGYSSLYTPTTVMKVPVTETDLRRYASYGYLIELYDTQADCSRFRAPDDVARQPEYQGKVDQALRYIQQIKDDLNGKDGKEGLESRLAKITELYERVQKIHANAPKETKPKLVADVKELYDSLVKSVKKSRESLAFWEENAKFWQGKLIPTVHILKSNGTRNRKTRRNK